MRKQISYSEKEDKTSLLFKMFVIWTFILLCRPQDYFAGLENLKPVLSIGILTSIIYIFSGKSYKSIVSDKQFRLYICFIVVLCVSVPFSMYRRASFTFLINYFLIVTTFYFLFYQLVDTINQLRTLLLVYSLGLSIYGIFIIEFGSYFYDRVIFGNMFDPNDIAFYFISILIFNLLFLSKKYSNIVMITSIINIIIGLIVIIKTGSRGGFLALIGVSVYLFIFKNSVINISFFCKIGLILITIISLKLFAVDTNRYQSILNIKSDYNFTEETGRIAIWQAGIRMILSNPLTGVGLNRFGEGIGRDREERGLASTYWQAPHNSIIQVGAETGVFGIIIYCLMSFNVFKITKRIIKTSGSDELIKISEMTRAGFIGLFIASMFLSQAYSIYWALFMILPSILDNLYKSELQIKH